MQSSQKYSITIGGESFGHEYGTSEEDAIYAAKMRIERLIHANDRWLYLKDGAIRATLTNPKTK